MNTILDSIFKIFDSFSKRFIDFVDPHYYYDHWIYSYHDKISYLAILLTLIIPFTHKYKKAAYTLIALATMAVLFTYTSGYSTQLKLPTMQNVDTAFRLHKAVTVFLLFMIIVSLFFVMFDNLNCSTGCIIGYMIIISLVATIVVSGIKTNEHKRDYVGYDTNEKSSLGIT